MPVSTTTTVPPPRRRRAWQLAVWIAVLGTLSSPGRLAAQTLPTLVIDAPATLEAVADDLRRLPREPLSTAMALAGLANPGSPINVLLIDEDAELARETPRWISGFADGPRSLVVMFPDRARSYPNDSLSTLLHHEVAHVLFSRAAGGRPVPRWFGEGLAMAAERPVGLADSSRLAWTLLRDGGLSLRELEASFAGGRGASQRAYAVSKALVEDLIHAYGDESPGRILAAFSRGASFEEAFQGVTGAPLGWAVDRFWRGQRFWGRWFPVLTGPTFLWMAITTLALLAFWVHRRRRAARRAAWAEEERIEAALETRRRTEQRARDLLIETDLDAAGSSYRVQ